MKQIINILFIIILFFSNTSCSEQNEPTDKFASTYWSYQKPHFEFEYVSDTIVFQMMQKQIKIEVNQFKNMFMALAQKKMNAYFKGIHFQDDHNMFIDIQNRQQQPFKIPAQYICDENYLQLNLNIEDIKADTNFPLGNIPPISFRYQIKDNLLTMYFEKVYIQVIYSIMGDSIAAMIIKAMDMDFSHAPEGMEMMAIQAIQKQLNEILQQTECIEIGFTMYLK